MAIERTMISWLRFAGTLGIGAFSVNVLGRRRLKGAPGYLGAAQAVVAVVIALSAYVRYRQRVRLVCAMPAASQPSRSSYAACMPSVL